MKANTEILNVYLLVLDFFEDSVDITPIITTYPVHLLRDLLFQGKQVKLYTFTASAGPTNASQHMTKPVHV